MTFTPNRRFRRQYDKIFRQDPGAANLFLLLAELADDKGQVQVRDEDELAELMAVRFDDWQGYQL